MLYYRIECWVGLLAVWGCWPPPTIAHNICPKTETVEMKVAVPQQEPVTFRSYTWCLKVPPRCSKYTVVMRERVTYQTVVRNQTLSECCPGYVRLYGECVAACQSCPNMHCDTGRNCTCTPGYIGPHCNHTCDAGKWGDRCLEACVCRVGEDCDPMTGSCSPSTSTTTTATTTTSQPTTATTPTSSEQQPATATTPKPTSSSTKTTANTFIDLTLTGPTMSSEDLTDFNVILRQKNDTLRFNNNYENNLNALGDLDYPMLPTDSVVESFNYIQPEHEPTKNIVVNSLNVNSSLTNDRWISELGSHSGVTLGSTLAIIILLVVTVIGVIRCRNSQATKQINCSSTGEKNSLHLVARNSHYAIPGPPSFSFINGLDLAKGISVEEHYDHPCSVRCLAANEPVYDELRY